MLIAMGVAVLCLPMLFAGWLLVATRSPRMDSLTLRLSPDMRELVAAAAMKRVGYGRDHEQTQPALLRVVRLDPKNAEAWQRLCDVTEDAKDLQADLRTCGQAATLDPSANNLYWLGKAREHLHDACGAEENYSRAVSKTSSQTPGQTNTYTYLEAMGRAALRCGDLPGARASLEAAIAVEDANLKVPDQDESDLGSTKADQAGDQEYLVVTLSRLKETGAERAACSTAHPEWKACACRLDEKDDVSCEEGSRR